MSNTEIVRRLYAAARALNEVVEVWTPETQSTFEAWDKRRLWHLPSLDEAAADLQALAEYLLDAPDDGPEPPRGRDEPLRAYILRICGDRSNAEGRRIISGESVGGLGWWCSLPRGHEGHVHAAHEDHDTRRPTLATWRSS